MPLRGVVGAVRALSLCLNVCTHSVLEYAIVWPNTQLYSRSGRLERCGDFWGRMVFPSLFSERLALREDKYGRLPRPGAGRGGPPAQTVKTAA